MNLGRPAALEEVLKGHRKADVIPIRRESAPTMSVYAPPQRYRPWTELAALSPVVCAAAPLQGSYDVRFTLGSIAGLQSRLRRSHAQRTMLEAQISKLAVLQDGWDGHGAVRPNDRAVESARAMLGKLFSEDLPPTEIDPDACGGVALWFYQTDPEGHDLRAATIECHNDGEVLMSTDDLRGTFRVQPFDIDALRGFLRGD